MGQRSHPEQSSSSFLEARGINSAEIEQGLQHFAAILQLDPDSDNQMFTASTFSLHFGVTVRILEKEK